MTTQLFGRQAAELFLHKRLNYKTIQNYTITTLLKHPVTQANKT